MKKDKKSFFSNFFGKKKNINEVQVSNDTIITPMQAIINNFKSNKLAMTGLIGFILIVLFTFGGSVVKKFDVLYTEPMLANIAPGKTFLNFPKELNGNVDKIVSGPSFTFAIDKDGKLHYWGVESDDVFKIPEKAKNKRFKDIAVSNRHVVALTKDGAVISWGMDEAGETVVPTSEAQKMSIVGIKKIFANRIYSGALLEDGSVVTWGGNNLNQRTITEDLKGKVEDVVALQENIVFLKKDGTLYVTGINTLSRTMPKELADGSVKVKKVAGAYLNVAALTEDGEVITWGQGGVGLNEVPQFEHPVKDITGGYNSFNALLENGRIVVWGDKAILGEKNVPNGKFTKVFSNFFQTYGVKEDGSIAAWGLKGYALGSDELGRDILVRLIHGGKTSLLVGVVAVVISTFVGVLIGLISGFMGGIVDDVLMRFAEVISSIPFLPLLITLSVVIGNRLSQSQKMYLVMVLIGLLSWVGLARLIRGQILIEREKDFVLASRALGIKQTKIVIKHILPSIISMAIVSMSLSYGGMMLTEAGLSFLGFGVEPPSPTWGNMLNGAQKAEVIQFYWWRWLFPALAVFLAVLTVNLMGDGIRDAVDPKANEK